MRIKFKNNTDVTFLDINIGEAFKIDEDDDVYMKIPCVECKYSGRTEIAFSKANAVSLINGELYLFNSDKTVTPLNGSFVEE